MATQTVSLGSMPSVPELEKALVAVVDNKIDDAVKELEYGSTDKLRKVARLALQLSAKRCFFCGDETSKDQRKLISDYFSGRTRKFDWTAVKPCDCLDEIRDVKNQLHASPQTYKVFMEGWDKDVRTLADLVLRGKMSPNTLLYGNKCHCGAEFTITAGIVARAVKKLPKGAEYQPARRCKDCAAKVREQKEARIAMQAGDTQPNNAGQPPRKKKQKNAGAVVLQNSMKPLTSSPFEEALKERAKSGQDVPDIESPNFESEMQAIKAEGQAEQPEVNGNVVEKHG